ncbi:hypothetical protein CTI14_00785 [Methylobacterium radiotolerans]|nr:hypothetical protein CTI14_00785 [Methylobacterium radiotolerans]
MDEWEVSLMVIAVEAGLWYSLTPEQRERIARRRCHIAVAICCATRCICGLSFAWMPSTDNVLAALRMVVVDKGVYADAVGALTPWDMHGTIEELVTDGGPSFSNARFRLACLILGLNPVLAVSGIPWLRGRIERVFRTVHATLIARFTGRTFENIVRKGDYKPERDASLTDEDFCWILVRYVVDIYHNRPHEGLQGRTPREVWDERARMFHVVPPPDRDTQRAAFGLARNAVLDHEGVRFLGLHYQSQHLQRHRRKHGHDTATVDVEMRIDPHDLGTVSVKLGENGAYLSVPCTTPGFDDIPIQTWMMALADIRARFSPDRVTSTVIQQANREIEARRKTAQGLAGVDPIAPTQEQIDHAEATLVIGFRILRSDADAVVGPQGVGGLYDDAVETGAALGDDMPTSTQAGTVPSTETPTPAADPRPSPRADDGPASTPKTWSLD